MKAQTVIGQPRIDERPERHYVGIRTAAPFSGMLGVSSGLLKELRTWVKGRGLAEEGPFFLRLHVIDMRGLMDIEVGFLTARPQEGDARVKPGRFPPGRYVSLIYRGKALAANKALIDWASANRIVMDRKDVPEGDAFACRYEAYLTDYRREPRKLLWDIELAIKLRD